ncbi:MAG TPA: hypothetical protein VFU89_03885 [Rhabdochlamydiaceae bacterium]|nr:hypothetical protein [Rhabdochlamydiaceae bacterium]
MTTTPPIDTAQLRFTQRTGPVNPGTPGSTQSQADSSIVTLNGKQYKITVEILINGEWKKVDASKFGSQASSALAQRCQEIYQQITHDPNSASTISVYFKTKDAAKNLTFQKLEYKTAGSSQLETFDIEKNEFEAETDAQRVDAFARSLLPMSSRLFSNPEQYIAAPARVKRTQQLTQQPVTQTLSSVKQLLNVREAGSQENRCATLSIAAILLQTYNGQLDDIAKIYKIPLNKSSGETDQIILSNGLIELAAQTIEKQVTKFKQDDFYSNIVAALGDAGQSIDNENDRDAVIAQYVTLIRKPGQMLDVPVFDALEMNGIPFITLVPNQARNDLVLGSVSGSISFDTVQRSLNHYDLTNICFVVRDGLHYQAVQMNSSLQQDTKLRSILKADMEKTLGQIQILLNDSRPTKAKDREFQQLLNHVVYLYPFDSKPRIIQMLTSANKEINPESVNSSELGFIAAALGAFREGTTAPTGDQSEDED